MWIWTWTDDGSDDRAKDAVAAMIKRLAHRNANVQLYTLEVGSCTLSFPSHQVHYIYCLLSSFISIFCSRTALYFMPLRWPDRAVEAFVTHMTDLLTC